MLTETLTQHFVLQQNYLKLKIIIRVILVIQNAKTMLTLSCPGTGRAVVKIGHSNLGPGRKELINSSLT